MDDNQRPTRLLNEAIAAFIQRGVSMNLASRDAGNMPTVARACGCRVSPDLRQVTVFLSPAQSEGGKLGTYHEKRPRPPSAVSSLLCNAANSRRGKG